MDDLIEAFNDADLKSASSTVHLGIVGPQVGREAVLERFRSCCQLPAVLDDYLEDGNEALTINAVRSWAQEHPEDATLYCHTKGAARPSELNRRWRRVMIARLIVPWRAVLAELKDYDAAGTFWIDPESSPYPLLWNNGFFGGNFWMARNDYLAKLPRCYPEPRTLTEEWIGLREPRVLDLLPGFPDYPFFGLPAPSAEA